MRNLKKTVIILLFPFIISSCVDTNVSEAKLKSILGDRWEVEEIIEEIPKTSTKSITAFTLDTTPESTGVIDEGAKTIAVTTLLYVNVDIAT